MTGVTFEAAMRLAREVRGRTDLSDRAKVIFCALVDRLNVDPDDKRNGQCNPKDETLAADCGMCIRSVQYGTAELKEAGLVEKKQTGRSPAYSFPGLSDELDLPTSYATSCGPATQELADQVDEPGKNVRTRSARTCGPATHNVCGPHKEQLSEQLNEQPTLSPPDGVERESGEADLFKVFWAVYPRRVARKAAEKAFNRIVKHGEATADELIAGAVAYQTECRALVREDRYVRHPATWLNGGGWTDEPAQAPPDKPSGVRRDGEGWIVAHGTEQFAAWKHQFRIESSPRQWEFRDEPGVEVRVPFKWPRRWRDAA